MQAEQVQQWAGEVAALMASRFGGARRGPVPDLATMLQRRGGALPRRLRREAVLLAEADRLSHQPRIARQLDLRAAQRAHLALTQHLRPLGALSRWRDRIGGPLAAAVLGLMLIAAAVIWMMVRRGAI
ncbi:hypothetical protein DRW48_12890 [Paracoccus suum]|uniref:Uncharacterized protein n=1 Tax=Paracoccus suum TaxID=2259340 RepID=A0A344PM50_9RHOB|nr:hypothetical protein [Paracoccus suum]AXC50455.1 hypothetical protein DRW48_12890 [Paracoccus suum]